MLSDTGRRDATGCEGCSSWLRQRRSPQRFSPRTSVSRRPQIPRSASTTVARPIGPRRSTSAPSPISTRQSTSIRNSPPPFTTAASLMGVKTSTSAPSPISTKRSASTRNLSSHSTAAATFIRSRLSTTGRSRILTRRSGSIRNTPSASLAAGVYALKAQYDRAIADFDQAIRLDPQQAVTFTGRGVANFNTGQFAAAAADFAQSLSLDARDGDVVLWLHLARARSNRDDAEELASNARMVDPKTWPGPILAYYRGRADADEVIRAAGNGNADMPRNQSWQAYFFVGEDAVLRQDIDEAARLLSQARDTCALDSFKRAAAEFELKRLPK